MSNHPIPLISPFQITQASMAQNAESLSPSRPGLPSTGAGTSAASVSTAGNAAATDVHLMQSSDATSFIYGSTATNKSVTTSDYTTVDDAAKLASRVATDNDVIDEIKREDRRKKKPKGKQSEDNDSDAEKNSEEIAEAPPGDDYHPTNTMMIASHGLV